MYVIDAWYSREAKHQYLSTFLSPSSTLVGTKTSSTTTPPTFASVLTQRLGSVIGAGPYLPTCPEYLTALFYIVA